MQLFFMGHKFFDAFSPVSFLQSHCLLTASVLSFCTIFVLLDLYIYLSVFAFVEW